MAQAERQVLLARLLPVELQALVASVVPVQMAVMEAMAVLVPPLRRVLSAPASLEVRVVRGAPAVRAVRAAPGDRAVSVATVEAPHSVTVALAELVELAAPVAVAHRPDYLVTVVAAAVVAAAVALAPEARAAVVHRVEMAEQEAPEVQVALVVLVALFLATAAMADLVAPAVMVVAADWRWAPPAVLAGLVEAAVTMALAALRLPAWQASMGLSASAVQEVLQALVPQVVRAQVVVVELVVMVTAVQPVLRERRGRQELVARAESLAPMVRRISL